MRSDAGEKHTAQKELYYTGLSRGFNLAFVGSASRSHKKPNFISYGSSEKVFLWIFLVWRIHIVLADRVSQD